MYNYWWHILRFHSSPVKLYLLFINSLTQSHISHGSIKTLLPLKVGDPNRCTYVSNALQENHNIYIQAINYPTVPRGSEKLRIAPTPWHGKEHVGDLLDALDDVWMEAGLPKVHPVCTSDCSCQVHCSSVAQGFSNRAVTVEA